MSAQIINFSLTADQEWVKSAECAKLGSPGMFPHEQDEQGIAWARATCAACPVRSECLTEALENGERFGVWGGLTSAERETIRRRASRTARKTVSRPLTASDTAALDNVQ